MKNLIIPLLISLSHFTFPQSTFWQKVESPTSEIIECLIKTPNGRIFAGLGADGIYYSEDNGISWEYFVHGCSGSYGDLLYGSDGNLYTSSISNICVFTPEGYGLYGKHFGTFIGELALNSQLHLYAVSSDSGIIRTTDQGETWEMDIIYPDSNIIFSSIAIDQSDNIFVSSFSGVYRSTDYGNSWLNIGLTSLQVRNVTVASNGDLLARTSYQIIRSTNNGDSWEFVGNGIPSNASISEIREDENSRLFLLAYQGSLRKVFSSLDWGLNWHNVFTPVDIYANEFLPYNNRVLLGTGNSGSSSSGTYIANLEDSTLISVHLIASDISNFIRSKNGILYAIESGIYSVSKDNGTLWKRIDYATSTLENFWISTDGEIVLVGGYGKAGVFIESGLHLYWTLGGYLAPVKSMVYDSESNYVFAATWEINYQGYIPGGLYRGELDYHYTTWDALTGGLPPDRSADLLSINSDGQIFVMDYGEIYRSDDKGTSWVLKNNGLDDLIGPTNIISDYKGYTYLTGYTNLSGVYNVYRTIDKGENWVNLNNGFSSIKKIVVDTENNLYVAQSTHIFKSTDSGVSWIEIGSGIYPTIVINGLFIDYENYLYAYGYRGVYRSTEPVTSADNDITNIPQNFNLSQNYPNPFNPTTKIKYTIPSFARIELKVYDMLGKEVAVLVNEEKPSGDYETNFDGSKLPSGIYFYQIKAGSFVETKKMVLLR